MIDFILGRRGHGKTTLGYYVTSQAARALVFDPRGQIRHRDERDHSAVAANATQLARGVGYLLSGELTECIFTPEENPRAGFTTFCREMARLIRLTPRGRKTTVLIDEIRFANLADENLDWVLRCSDVDQFRIVFTGHRPKDVPPDIRAIANRWLLFRFTLPRDFDVIEEHTSPQVAARVKQLGAREFLSWDDSKDGYELFRHPAAWFVPLGLPPVPDEEPRPELEGEREAGVDSGLPFDE